MPSNSSPQYAVFGSYAYDTILLHGGTFHSRILPEEIARLNVSFGVDSTREELGGTAGNIAFNAALLEDYPLLLGSVGEDFGRYAEHLRKLGHETDTLTVQAKHSTARAWLLTDTEHNQISAFHMGAQAAHPAVPTAAGSVSLWHIAPESPSNMLSMAVRAKKLQVSYMFDPGQALPGLLEIHARGETDLREVIRGALGLFVNDYEAELLEQSLNCTLESLVASESFVVRTMGSRGAQLFTQGDWEHTPTAKPRVVVDPTGCGDALRAGFLHGYLQGQLPYECVRLGVVMASFAVEHSGGQNHSPSKADIERRMADFGARSLA